MSPVGCDWFAMHCAEFFAGGYVLESFVTGSHFLQDCQTNTRGEGLFYMLSKSQSTPALHINIEKGVGGDCVSSCKLYFRTKRYLSTSTLRNACRREEE